jgi:hypothetical protein
VSETSLVAIDRRDLAERAGHWDAAYGRSGPAGVSWYASEPTLSLLLIDLFGISADTAVIDIGGGGSPLAASLLDRSFNDVTVLDISAVALEETRRLTNQDARVRYLQEDVLSWQPRRRYGLWHDRACFHFLTDDGQRRAYRRALYGGMGAGGSVIIATFAPDGPQRCSGLPVRRYQPEDLSRELGNRFEPVEARREEHLTPNGNTQPFTWVAGRIAA